jgi:Tol biopolymer transport system component
MATSDAVVVRRGRQLCFLVLLALAITMEVPSTALAHAATTPSSGPSGRIVFVTSRDGNNEIYIMNADASAQRNLTNNPADDRDPRLSPDGTQIAFASNRTGNFNIYVMKVDGSGLSRLTTSSASDREPAWTADGEHIIFASDRSGTSQIYRMNADGTQQTRLTNDSANDFQPATSPRGPKIVFVSNRQGVSHLFTINDDGNALRQVTSGSSPDSQPAWSPGGNQLAFVRQDANGIGSVNTVHTDGSALTRLTNRPDRQESDPTWSPDGTKIAFHGCVTFVNGANYCQLFSVHANGSDESTFSLPAPSVPFTDNFDAAAMDTSFWTTQPLGTGVNATQTSGRVEISFAANAAPGPFDVLFLDDFHSQCLLQGNYDYQADFTLVNWPPGNGVFVDLVSDADGNMGLTSGVPIDGYENFFDDGSASVFVPTTDTSGSFRIVRSTDTISVFYRHNDNWNLLTTGQASTIDTTFNLLAGSSASTFAGLPVTVVFDNFRINAGTLTCPFDATQPNWHA